MKDELTMFCHQSPPLFSAALGLPPHGHAARNPRPVQGWTCRPLPRATVERRRRATEIEMEQGVVPGSCT